MTKDVEVNARCKGCGAELSPNHTGPCPSCGKKGKKISIKVTETLRLSGLISWELRREFYEKNSKFQWLLISLTFGSPFLGLILAGLIGLVFGLILAAISYILGPLAVTKVREIHRGRSQ